MSVITVAAVLCRSSDVVDGGTRYKDQRTRKLMLEKIRMILRVAGRKGERRLVLGALGCGAFGNPPTEVANLWKWVLQEKEFSGWWEDVVFAVYVPPSGDHRAMANFSVFREILNGLRV